MTNQQIGELSYRLIEECLAILEGRYCEERAVTGRPRPSWVWLNLPAHGPSVDLRARCAAADRHPPPEGSWQAARAEVCRIAEALAPEFGGLLGLQRQVLLPLELDLMAGDVHVRTPAALVAQVLLRLDAAFAPPFHDGS